MANIGKSDVVLDVGCGDGDLLSRIKDTHLSIGIDLSSIRVRRAKQKGIEVLVADAQQLPFRKETFTMCFAIEVLEHVHDPPNVIQEVRRVLGQGGCLVVVLPNDHNWFVYRVLAGDFAEALHFRGHLHDLSRLDKLRTAFEGFRTVEVRQNKQKPLILLEGAYKIFVKVATITNRILRSAGLEQNVPLGVSTSVVLRVSQGLRRFLPIPELALHLVVKLVKDPNVRDNIPLSGSTL